jgi:hypothetical protein
LLQENRFELPKNLFLLLLMHTKKIRQQCGMAENKANQSQFEAPAHEGPTGTAAGREHFPGLGRRELPTA